jgi:hypothetical protein
MKKNNKLTLGIWDIKSYLNLQGDFLLFIQSLSLPSVYKLTSKKQLTLLFLLILSSILTNNQIINIFDNYPNFKILIFNLTLIYFLYIIFNLIIRIYNMIYKTLNFFIQTKLENKKIIYMYYFFNLFLSLLTILLIIKINKNLSLLDTNFNNYIHIYIFLFSFPLALMYIDYTSENKIEIKNLKVKNKKLILFLISLLIFYGLILYLNDSLIQNYIIKNNLSNKFSLNMFPQNKNTSIVNLIESNKGEMINKINNQEANTEITKMDQNNIKTSNSNSGNSTINNTKTITNSPQNTDIDPNIIDQLNPLPNISVSKLIETERTKFFNAELKAIDYNNLEEFQTDNYLKFLDYLVQTRYEVNLREAFKSDPIIFKNYIHTLSEIGDRFLEAAYEVKSDEEIENYVNFVQKLEYALHFNVFKINKDYFGLMKTGNFDKEIVFFNNSLALTTKEIKVLMDVGDLKACNFNSLHHNFLYKHLASFGIDSLDDLNYFYINKDSIAKLKLKHMELQNKNLHIPTLKNKISYHNQFHTHNQTQFHNPAHNQIQAPVQIQKNVATQTSLISKISNKNLSLININNSQVFNDGNSQIENSVLYKSQKKSNLISKLENKQSESLLKGLKKKISSISFKSSNTNNLDSTNFKDNFSSTNENNFNIPKKKKKHLKKIMKLLKS